MHIQMKNLVERFLQFCCSKAMPTIFEFREGKASCLAALLPIPSVFFRSGYTAHAERCPTSLSPLPMLASAAWLSPLYGRLKWRKQILPPKVDHWAKIMLTTRVEHISTVPSQHTETSLVHAEC